MIVHLNVNNIIYTSYDGTNTILFFEIGKDSMGAQFLACPPYPKECGKTTTIRVNDIRGTKSTHIYFKRDRILKYCYSCGEVNPVTLSDV